MRPTRTLRRLLSFVAPFPWAFPAVVGLGLLSALSEGLGIALLIPFFHLLFEKAPAQGAFGAAVGILRRHAPGLADFSDLPILAAAIVGLIAAKSLLAIANVALWNRVVGEVAHRLRVSILQRLLHVEYAAVALSDRGRLLNVVQNEASRAANALSTLFSMCVSGCAVLILAPLLLLIDWRLALGIGVGAALISGMFGLLNKPSRRLGDAAVEASSVLAARAAEVLAEMRTVRLFGKEAHELDRFARASVAARKTSYSMCLLYGLIQPVQETLYVPLFIGLLVFASSIGYDLATLFAVLVLFLRLQPHLRMLDQCRVWLAQLSGAVNEVASLLEGCGKPAELPRRVRFHGLRHAIELHHVAFRYAPNREAVLKDVSLVIPKGRIVALVGASGVGKSTLIGLLVRLFDPTAGTITVDGHRLRDLDPADWRRHVAVAGQDLGLLSGTIRENITYGCPAADDASVKAAAVASDADAVVAALPEGYDTDIGERGLRLSGGERQRIGLARALACDPDILILDEATNALDGLSERAVKETLRRLRRDKAIVVIAHRFSTVRQADCVYVMDDGRIVESGTPSDLLRRDGAFARLYASETSRSELHA